MTDNGPDSDPLLTPEQVCRRLGVTNTQLQDWRKTKTRGGPPFIRLGHRTIRYRASAVEAFIAAGESGE